MAFTAQCSVDHAASDPLGVLHPATPRRSTLLDGQDSLAVHAFPWAGTSDRHLGQHDGGLGEILAGCSDVEAVGLDEDGTAVQ
jgi:hypothetical protein